MMDMLVVEGGHPLSGDLPISGSKNASLPLLAASLLSRMPSTLTNVPQLADTKFLLELFSSFGLHYHIDKQRVNIDASKIAHVVAHYDMVRKMRASILVLAPLLARCGEAVVSLPGGCAIGSRPVDLHLLGLKKLGADLRVKDGYIHAHLPGQRFVGTTIDLELPSVGATENIVMAAALARGQTILHNAAMEPEVVELCHALNEAGARIRDIGTSTLVIDGVNELNGLTHRVSPDRIEAGSFIALAAMTKSNLTLKNVVVKDIANIMSSFSEAGVRFECTPISSSTLSDIKVQAPERLLATNIETAVYPGFPTDMQAQFMAAMTIAEGTSTITENVFENRMMHVPELLRMGAHIEVHHGTATVHGLARLTGAPVMATDLRASASLVIAALAADGVSEIRRVYHLDRGYEAMEQKLVGVGAKIRRCAQT